MGVSRSPLELAQKFQRAATQVGFANEDGVKAAANVYKAAVLREAKRDVGGDLRMSNWGRKGVKLGAQYSVRRAGPRTFALLTPRPAGVWSALNSGTKPHDVAPGARSDRARRRSKRKAVRMPDGRFVSAKREIMHPGSKGKGTWRRGTKLAEPAAKRVFVAAHRRSLGRVFR